MTSNFSNKTCGGGAVRNTQVELKRTPVGASISTARSTKVDAEYNLPAWVPETQVNLTKRSIQGVDIRVRRVLPRVLHIQGTFREYRAPPHERNHHEGRW
jgi:hypothetical protein